MKEVTVQELKPLLGTVAIIDVREPEEYVVAHVPGAQLVPLATVPVSLDELDKSQTQYMICKGGVRSARAGEFLAELGFDVVNVVGGTDAWIESGEPFNTGELP